MSNDRTGSRVLPDLPGTRIERGDDIDAPHLSTVIYGRRWRVAQRAMAICIAAVLLILLVPLFVGFVRSDGDFVTRLDAGFTTLVRWFLRR